MAGMDLSPAIAWLMPGLGLLAAIAFGRRRSPRASGRMAMAAALVALTIGVVLTFVQVFAHSACVEQWHLCPNRGDGNMSYWFQSFLAIPLYWAASFATWKLTK